MNEKKCKHCATMIPKDAKICPNCRKRQGVSFWLIGVAIFFGLSIVGTIISAIVGPAGSPGNTAPSSENMKKEDAPVTAKAREEFASSYEQRMLSEGMDVHVRVSGNDKKTIQVKWVLLSRPLVYKLTREGDMLENFNSMGFTKVILTDGYNSTWSYDLGKVFSKDGGK